MGIYNGLYWVNDLSNEAQRLLFNHCKRQLQKLGYEKNEIERHLEEIACDKLGSVGELVSNKLMSKYCSM